MLDILDGTVTLIFKVGNIRREWWYPYAVYSNKTVCVQRIVLSTFYSILSNITPPYRRFPIRDTPKFWVIFEKASCIILKIPKSQIWSLWWGGTVRSQQTSAKGTFSSPQQDKVAQINSLLQLESDTSLLSFQQCERSVLWNVLADSCFWVTACQSETFHTVSWQIPPQFSDLPPPHTPPYDLCRQRKAKVANPHRKFV